MMLRIGDDGVVSSVNEEDLIYVDKNELEQLIENYRELEKENEQLKENAKQVLFVLSCADLDFKLSINEANAIKRLNEIVDGCFDVKKLGSDVE